MGGIRLHKEHCLNPSLNLCFWCGESKDIILFGATINGKAPHEIVMDYDPCDKCKDKMTLGVTLIECSETSDGGREIQKGLYPTGRWWVISHEASNRMFNGTEGHNKMFIATDIAEKIGLPDNI